MNHDHSNHDQGAVPSGSFWTSRAFLVCLGFAAIAIILLWKEHQAHILGALPFLFLLACPLMHIFMHGGHGHGGHGDRKDGPSSDRATSELDGGKS